LGERGRGKGKEKILNPFPKPNFEFKMLNRRGQMQWVSRISQALESDWFCLYAQKIAAIAPTDQNGDHYEVLLRLRDEQGNLVLPMAFIPAAERYN
jgi:sensor c-di-GMP phosphodiesterase-like protein